jgi:FAD/FMN-containing dehydrogenase
MREHVCGLAGDIHWRGEDGYEELRRRGFNQRVPDRHPAVIVCARTPQDVVAAVALARERRLKVTTRSGGHNWQRAFLREGAMLIDVQALDYVTVGAMGGLTTVGPGLTGTELNRRLAPHGLFFPTGHCTSVGIGGFLLQGGFGWNSRLWGPACASVEAIDVVTASGELVRADASHHADLFWAARGSGHGFFGVVTRFHLRLHPRPPVCLVSSYVYPIEVLEEVLRWAHGIRNVVSRLVEAMVFVRRGLVADDAPAALVLAPALADSEAAAREALAILETCPVLDRALTRDAYRPTSIDELLAASEEIYPGGRRWAVDNMWTDTDDVDSLLNGIRPIVETLPASPSHMLWLLWGPAQSLADMAFSLQGELYIALYGVSEDDATDGRNRAWATGGMRALEPLATGIQLADENLGERPFRFVSDESLRRLSAVRSQYDPGAMFHTWMGAS